MANRVSEPSPLGSHRRIRGLLVAAAIVAIAAFAAGRWTAPSGSPATQEDSTPQPPAASPTLPEESGAGAYPRTQAGAVRAASDYVRVLSPTPGETRRDYARRVRAIASVEWGDEMESTIASWDDGTGEGAVLRYRVDSFSPDRAEVVLWVVGLVDLREAPPTEVWGRSFMTLLWEDATWKVAAEDGDVGPKPPSSQQPSSPEELRRILEGFEFLDHDPAATP